MYNIIGERLRIAEHGYRSVREKKPPETWHMAGPSEAKAHYKNHAPRRLAAAPGGLTHAGALVFACAFASLGPAMCRRSLGASIAATTKLFFANTPACL